MGWDLPTDTTKRGSLPSAVEYLILAWVAGLIWSEIKQLWDVGLKVWKFESIYIKAFEFERDSSAINRVSLLG